MLVSKDIILAVMPKAPANRAQALANMISKYGEIMGLVSPNALAIFLGNVAHESNQLNDMKEKGSASYLQGKSYFPFIGFGPIQVTHEDHYKLVSNYLYNDNRFVNNPASIFNDDNALMLGSLIWWKNNYFTNYQGFKKYADAGNGKAISNILNTGNNKGTNKKGQYVTAKISERLKYISLAASAIKKKIYSIKWPNTPGPVLMPLWNYLSHIFKSKQKK
jgi:predicted chitinase